MFSLKTLKRSLRRLVREESGQGLVEFAVVLPILLLLTVGTILLTLSYIQKARMNGLAFMSARVAAVRRSNVDAASYTIQQYRQRTGQNWLQEVSSQPQQAGPDQVVIRLRKPGERVDVFANLVSGQPNQQPLDLVVQMQLPKEYSEKGSLRPQTYTEVNYQYQPVGIGELLGGLKVGLIKTDQMADSTSVSIGERNRMLSLDPPDGNLKKFYADRNWEDALKLNDEAADGQFKSMQTTYKTFELIETGGDLLANLLKLFTAFAGPLVDIIGNLGAEAIGVFEASMSKVSDGVDSNVRNSYR